MTFALGRMDSSVVSCYLQPVVRQHTSRSIAATYIRSFFVFILSNLTANNVDAKKMTLSYQSYYTCCVRFLQRGKRMGSEIYSLFAVCPAYNVVTLCPKEAKTFESKAKHHDPDRIGRTYRDRLRLFRRQHEGNPVPQAPGCHRNAAALTRVQPRCT